MQVFRKYLEEKLSRAEFKAAFDEECCVCKITALLINRLEGEDFTVLAREAECDLTKIRELRDGDHCDPLTVLKLHQYLGLDLPPCPRLLNL